MKPHRWREYVVDVYRRVVVAWEWDRETVALGYGTEMEEYELENPRPTFKEALIGNRGLGPWS